MHSTIDVLYTVGDAARKSARRVPFVKIGRSLLPRSYTLSVAVTGDVRARKLNVTYRKKSYAPNVLAFPLSPKNGEIILNIQKAKREARAIGIPTANRVAHLYIHAILHLLGLRHGGAMEKKERFVLKKFSFQ